MTYKLDFKVFMIFSCKENDQSNGEVFHVYTLTVNSKFLNEKLHILRLDIQKYTHTQISIHQK